MGVGDGQEGLVCCSPWGGKELDMTDQLNWTEVKSNWLMINSSNINTVSLNEQFNWYTFLNNYFL